MTRLLLRPSTWMESALEVTTHFRLAQTNRLIWSDLLSKSLVPFVSVRKTPPNEPQPNGKPCQAAVSPSFIFQTTLPSRATHP
mmetsp:Transcript_8932/g.17988  ORF Transcript_8932/g.17988 Transcript_8932/m.17988 type:complete len:83 (-) Transcript_8932:101-349(-)